MLSNEPNCLRLDIIVLLMLFLECILGSLCMADSCLRSVGFCVRCSTIAPTITLGQLYCRAFKPQHFRNYHRTLILVCASALAGPSKCDMICFHECLSQAGGGAGAGKGAGKGVMPGVKKTISKYH